MSFRQEVVRNLHDGAVIYLSHDAGNSVDPWACAVHTELGQIIGFVPKALAQRLTSGSEGGSWRGRVTDMYLWEGIWGVEIEVQEVCERRAVQQVPGLTNEPLTTVDLPPLTPVVEAQAEGEEVLEAWTTSGRRLGVVDKVQDGFVQVSGDRVMRWPISVVTLLPSVSS